MKSSIWIVGLIMLLVAGGVYFGLEKFSGKSEEVTEETAAVEEFAPPEEDVAPMTDDASVSETPVTEDVPAEVVETAPAEEMAAEPTPVEEPATAVEPAAEEVAVAEPAPTEPTPAPVARKPRSAPPAADHITRWWPDASQMPRSQLKLIYAGQAQDQRTIALLFSEKLDPDTFRQNLKVLSSDGQTLKGDWTLGKNERMAMFKVGKPGRYTVVLKETLADITDHILGTPLQGPVYIQ